MFWIDFFFFTQDFLLNPIQRAFEYYVEMGRKMEEEKQKTQEKQVKKFSPDYERKLDKEMHRKLSREFDKRLHQEIQKKFVEEKERKLSGDFRHIHPNNTSGANNNARKASFDNNRNEHLGGVTTTTTTTTNTPSLLTKNLNHDKNNTEEGRTKSSVLISSLKKTSVGDLATQNELAEETPVTTNGHHDLITWS